MSLVSSALHVERAPAQKRGVRTTARHPVTHSAPSTSRALPNRSRPSSSRPPGAARGCSTARALHARARVVRGAHHSHRLRRACEDVAHIIRQPVQHVGPEAGFVEHDEVACREHWFLQPAVRLQKEVEHIHACKTRSTTVPGRGFRAHPRRPP